MAIRTSSPVAMIRIRFSSRARRLSGVGGGESFTPSSGVHGRLFGGARVGPGMTLAPAGHGRGDRVGRLADGVAQTGVEVGHAVAEGRVRSEALLDLAAHGGQFVL